MELDIDLIRFVPVFCPLTVLEVTGLLLVSACPTDSGDQPLCLFLGGPVFAIDPLSRERKLLHLVNQISEMSPFILFFYMALVIAFRHHEINM